MADSPLPDLSFRLPAVAKPSEHLINLCRAAVEAQRAATSEPYTKERWAAWTEAAEAFQRAAVEEAGREPKQSRLELEQAAKKAVLHPEADES
ncbi:hypothetical protein I3W98_10110 [Streptomyces cavourensis]|nr:hypothetical protein [Streptomyces cavourensis]